MLSPRRILTCLIIMAFFLALPQSNYGWDDTGHMMVARIAWDNLSPAARQQMIALLMQAPANSCLRELFPQDNRPLAERERQFFIAAATWPDVIRPRDNDTRPCRLLHHREWHFVDHFWSGTSGSPNDPPHDVNIAIAQINAAERLQLFRNQVGSTVVPVSERAMLLAWILHLVGDIHQPLHTSGRVTNSPGENDGDAGGNDFLLGSNLNLHSYWDTIIDRHAPRLGNENFTHYVDRLSGNLEIAFPLASFSGTLQPGNINAWVLESLQKAKDNAYPRTLMRDQLPNNQYETNAFQVAQRSIAESGYRLANLLSQIFH